jgi:hypothetical protein
MAMCKKVVSLPHPVQINIKKQLVREKKKGKKQKTQQHRLGTNVRVRRFNAGLLAKSQLAFGRS